ncbi:MAG: penicillin-binding protein [Gammaproteobacteria bacterium]|nr:penicillin-binding protein [Gammaproteobacteria bacterium]
MSDKLSGDALHALKIAFSYMPNAIEVTKYEYGDHYTVVLEHIEAVKEILLLNGVDPDEVQGEINPEHTPNSSY